MIKMELLRRVKGISQAQLAQDLMYSQGYISSLEKGSRALRRVHPSLKKALEDYFGESLEELLKPVAID